MVWLLWAGGHTPNPAAGANTYAWACASCHGADGTLGVQVAGAVATDLTVAVPSLDTDVLVDIAQNGTGAMPAPNLSRAEARDVASYLVETFDP